MDAGSCGKQHGQWSPREINTTRVLLWYDVLLRYDVVGRPLRAWLHHDIHPRIGIQLLATRQRGQSP
jgi:hypothetical protein